jgi:hypothetical protein
MAGHGGRPHSTALRDKLALEMARGGTVAAFGKANGIADRTLYEWTAKPAFQAEVTRHRRAITDRTVGALVRFAVRAVKVMANLSENAQSESVRLSAARGILTELISVSSWADLEQRIADIERKLGHVKSDGTHPTDRT